MRRKVTAALRNRSAAIHAAVGRYNAAAAKLRPLLPPLDFSKVLEYVTVGHFDVLRLNRGELSTRPWAQSENRECSRSYYKVTRAKEELVCVCVEARRLKSYIEDLEERTQSLIMQLNQANDPLAHEVQKLSIRQRPVFAKHRIELGWLLSSYSTAREEKHDGSEEEHESGSSESDTEEELDIMQAIDRVE